MRGNIYFSTIVDMMVLFTTVCHPTLVTAPHELLSIDIVFTVFLKFIR